MTRFWGLAAAAALAFATTGAEAAGYMTFPTEDSGATTFVMPSGNIGCIYTPAGGSTVYTPADGGPELSCDRVEPAYLRFILAASGAGQTIKNVGDASCCGSANELPYGTVWQLEPFTCVSAINGLTCIRDDGHGFFISKARTQAY
jgi:hypothetical protein